MNLYNRIMAWAGNVWGFVMVSIFAIMILIIVGFFLNWLGIGGINFVVVLFLIPVLFGLMFAPEISVNLLLGAVVSGILQQPQTIRSEIETFFKTYLNFVKGLVLGLLLIFIFLAVAPISENPGGFFALAVIVPAIILSASFWGFAGTWGKKFAYWSLILVAGIIVASFIPNDIYKNVIGFAPYQIFGRSETGKTLQEVEERLEKNADEAQVKRLEIILDKVEDGKTLSQEEQTELDQIRKEVNKKSLPVRTKKIGREILEKTGEVAGDATKKVKKWWQTSPGASQGEKTGGFFGEYHVNPSVPRNFGKDVPPGNYRVEPWAEGLFVRFLISSGKWIDKEIPPNGKFSVGVGDNADSIGGRSGIFQIYKS